jgi:hypothetical protein
MMGQNTQTAIDPNVDSVIDEDKDSKTAEPEVLSLKDEASNKNSSNGQDGEKGTMGTPKDTKRDGVEDNFKIESSEVANGFKFLILSLNAYAAKQYEEAGALFAQAAECGDVTRLTNALLEPITGHFPASQAPITTENLQQLAGDEEDAEDGEGEEEWEPEDGDEDEDEDESMDDASSESSGGAIIHRRKVTSLNQIGKMLAASMEVTASEEDPDAEGEAEEESTEEDASTEEEDAAGEEDTSDAEAEEEGGEGEGDDSDTEEGDEEDTAPEPDPDVPGASLIPVSFSSAVKVKLEVGSDVKSPIRLKN